MFGPAYFANRAKLRVKIKSLAAESAIIRREEKKYDGQSSERGMLRWHRIKDVREESRAAQLAYAYLRKRPYKTVEKLAVNPVPIKRVEALVKKYGQYAAIEGLEEWFWPK